MAFTSDYSVQEFDIELRASTSILTQSVINGSTQRSLEEFGFTAVNPYDLNYKFGEAMLPDQDGAIPLHDGKRGPSDIILVSQLADDTPYDLYADQIKELRRAIGVMKSSENYQPYIKYGIWNGASLTYYRLYIDIKGITCPLVPKSRWTVTQPIQIQCRLMDPFIYEDVEIYYDITVVNGSGLQIVTNPGGNVFSRRCYWRIDRDQGENVDEVTISNGLGQSFTVDCNLTASNHKMHIDAYLGNVYKAEGATNYDKIDEYSGDFFGVDDTANVFTITENTNADFNIRLQFLNPHM